MTPRQIRRAADRRARKEARKQEKAAAAVAAPIESADDCCPARPEKIEIPRTRVDEAALLSEPKIQKDEAALLSEPKIQKDEAALLSEPKTRQEINRANARRSTGPKTIQGKANSSSNSFKHGLYSKQLITSAEEAAELDALKADLRAEHQPTNTTEEILVNEMAEQFWRIRRARRYEATLLDGDIVISHWSAVQRMMTSAERGFHKSLNTLRQLQRDRGVHSTPASAPGSRSESSLEPGFVPQKASQESGSLRNPARKQGDGFVPQSGDCGFVPQNHELPAVPRANGCEAPLLQHQTAVKSLTADSCKLTAPPGFVPQNAGPSGGYQEAANSSLTAECCELSANSSHQPVTTAAIQAPLLS